MSMTNYSPLRYPGGKSAIYPIIADIIKSNKIEKCIYVEPFAGGANIAWRLLIDGVVERIIINDADKAVYSFWRAILEEPQWFVKMIETTPVTVDEWRRQRSIIRGAKRYSKEIGFAMFYLNRTNRSGIIEAGPIGGYNQNGKYAIDCRYNKEVLINKILTLYQYRSRVKVYNQDISIFIRKYLPSADRLNNTFIYFDPPYYEKGQRLYLNHFTAADHKRLRNDVENLNCRWIMTYDDQLEIRQLYSQYAQQLFSINYSLSKKKKGGELMIYKDESCIPSLNVINNLPKTVGFNNLAMEANSMTSCRFCSIVNKTSEYSKPENEVLAESDKFFAISSIGALVEGWVLVIPKDHHCSMRSLYNDSEFRRFAGEILSAIKECYGPVIAFEHGPNHEGSDTSCGTDHAHIHFVPYHSIRSLIEELDLAWKECRSSQIEQLVDNNEYLFYCEPGTEWDDPLGLLHILSSPISQFFRRIIAQDQGNYDNYNYKAKPNTIYTLKTIERMRKHFAT